MRVICIKQHSHGILTVGKIYEVCDMTTCNCGKVLFNIDLVSIPGVVCKCGFKLGGNVWWVNSKLFAPLEEKGQMFIEEFIELEELI